MGFKIFLNKKKENQFEFYKTINQNEIKLIKEGENEKSKKEIKFLKKRTKLNEESEILTNEIINKNSSNKKKEKFHESDNDNNDNKISDSLFNDNINNNCDDEIKYELENNDIKNLLFCIKDGYNIILTMKFIN